MSESDMIISEVNLTLSEIPSNCQKNEYIVSTFRYSTRFSNYNFAKSILDNLYLFMLISF